MNEFVIEISSSTLSAIKQLNNLENSNSLTLFVVRKEILLGTITDGDIRRGIIKGHDINSNLINFINKNYHYILNNDKNIFSLKNLKDKGIKLVPVVDERGRLIDIIDLNKQILRLPMSALIMAGGLGTRLRPLTDKTPKPMLKFNGKPILEHNINLLKKNGIKEIFISVNYLKEQIINYFEDGSNLGVKIIYLIEEKPLGTIGSLSKIEKIENNLLLVLNSDIITDVDFELFYLNHIETNSKMSVLSIPYEIKIPYAVLNLKENFITGFSEKPNLTYYTNGGMYIINFDEKIRIPQSTKFDATDLMQEILKDNSLSSYKHHGNWVDIGNPDDLLKGEKIFKKIEF